MKCNLDNKLWNIILKLQKNSFGQKIVPLIMDSCIVKAYNDFVYHRDEKNPTKEMQDARMFYSANQGRVDTMISCLADDKSKEVLNKVIKYRQTHCKKDRPPYSRKDQYFPTDIIRLNKDEVFVDCGAYNGDTIRSFLKYSDYKYKKIIAFEPDSDNTAVINNMHEKITVIESATWNENTALSFENGLGSSSRVSKEGQNQVSAVKIDSVPECTDATFIKMDIEGAEYNALVGAECTIRGGNQFWQYAFITVTRIF